MRGYMHVDVFQRPAARTDRCDLTMRYPWTTVISDGRGAVAQERRGPAEAPLRDMVRAFPFPHRSLPFGKASEDGRVGIPGRETNHFRADAQQQSWPRRVGDRDSRLEHVGLPSGVPNENLLRTHMALLRDKKRMEDQGLPSRQPG